MNQLFLKYNLPVQLKTHWFGIRIGRNADEGAYPELDQVSLP